MFSDKLLGYYENLDLQLRLRGDIIEVFKIFKGFENSERSGSRSCSLGDNIWLRTILGGPAASFNFPFLNQVPG